MKKLIALGLILICSYSFGNESTCNTWFQNQLDDLAYLYERGIINLETMSVLLQDAADLYVDCNNSI